MFSSIRTRLTLSHLAVIVVAMGLSGFLLLSLLERYYLEAMEDSLAAQARITAQALIPGSVVAGPELEAPAVALNRAQQQLDTGYALQAENVAPPPDEVPLSGVDLDYLADASLQLSSQLATRIRVLDAQGVVMVDSALEDKGKDLGRDPLVAQALAGEYARRTDSPGRGGTMYLAQPVLFEGKLVGAVYLSETLDDMATVLSDLRLRWLASMAVALCFSAVVGLALSGAIARPLKRLTAAAEAVSRGKLDQQVPVDSTDELGRLSLTFNEMTARLRAARRTQLAFVANVSHELRTPLTAIKGFVETLRDGAVDDIEVRDHFLETVEDETDRLIRLVNDLLTLSRADSAALDLQRQPVDLTLLAQTTAQWMGKQAGARGVHLRVTAQEGAPRAMADPDRIEQVLINLLDNAIKYSRPGGTVTVSISGERGSLARVEIRDEGIGIPEEDLARIGERFYRADRARARSEGGSGLGVAIARALVEAHDGRLWLESRESVGTSVTFTLPAARP